ncbi:ABC-2 family transporter protein [Streptosporangium subroseum]|uniref:ABC-2 family transporter protein n=1 Tax=Streptosporangium subroseum TaxID=106412 RepID=A0A239L2L4_9ACTN|nr:ABC transporter permease subunit [Streptosporangium subroseum]SNT24575.1 ABC-2 family transporter protein [Streptosporangium subroseum]
MTAAIADTVRSEWTKFRSIPSNVPVLLVTVAVMVGAGALTAGGASKGYQAAGAAFDATYISMYGGFLFAQISVGSLGVLVVTSEYATGMIRTSLTVVPRRGRLLAAKVWTFGVIALVMGEVAAFGSFLLGQTVIGAAGAPAAELGHPGVLRAVVGMGLIWALVGLIGVALGCLLRDTMAATTVVVAVNFIIPIIGPRLMPAAVGDWVTTYWPISAGLQVTTTVHQAGRLAPWTGLGLMAAFTAVLLMVAFVVFRSRDA